MDRKALYDLSYGVFLLSAKAGDRVNGCITNTCIQVASSPVRVAFSVLNGNLTCEVLKEGGVFCLTVLDQSVTPETIRHFGAQSGRDVDKFGSFRPAYDENGVPYLPWQSCARLSGRVVSRQDLGSHTLFVAELEQAQVPAGGAVSGVLVARGHDMTSSTSVISPRIERRASIAV